MLWKQNADSLMYKAAIHTDRVNSQDNFADLIFLH